MYNEMFKLLKVLPSDKKKIQLWGQKVLDLAAYLSKRVLAESCFFLFLFFYLLPMALVFLTDLIK